MSACKEWDGRRNEKGYGTVGVRLAHRIKWEEVNGPIPDGLCVLHECDNPPCVNIDHLFLGTRADNVADMVAKDRSAKGESHSHAKLTDADIREIRESKVSSRKICNRYGVCDSTIRHVRRGFTWTHV